VPGLSRYVSPIHGVRDDSNFIHRYGLRFFATLGVWALASRAAGVGRERRSLRVVIVQASCGTRSVGRKSEIPEEGWKQR
jgi:hypothetical protein